MVKWFCVLLLVGGFVSPVSSAWAQIDNFTRKRDHTLPLTLRVASDEWEFEARPDSTPDQAPGMRGTVGTSDRDLPKEGEVGPTTRMAAFDVNAPAPEIKAGSDEDTDAADQLEAAGETQTSSDAEPDEPGDAPNATSLSFRGTVAVSGGWDSNPDEDVDGRSQGIDRYDADVTADYEGTGVEVEFLFKGTFYNVRDLDPPNRWKYEAGYEGRGKVTDRTYILFGARREHDAASTTDSAENEGFVGVETKIGNAIWTIRGTLANEDQLSGDFGAEDRAAFSYIKSSIGNRLILRHEDAVSPFFDVRLSKTHHVDQDAASVNRNAEGLTAIAGVILKPSQDTEAQVGLRYNVRDFRRSGRSADHWFVDASIAHETSDRFKLAASATREFKETSTEDALVDDETTYEISAVWKPHEKWQINTRGAYTETKRLRSIETEEELEAEVKTSYLIREAMKLFALFSYLENTTKSPGDAPSTYERIIVRAGIEAEF